jgi:lysophospholipid acyltransferase (LPLAT)-like uncharacterized protein
LLFPRVAARIIGAGILGLRATIRIEEIHPERERDLQAKGVPLVYALWHGRMVLCILARLHENIVTMASRSKDGEIIARWLVRNGYVPVRGSTRKGGLAALQEMIDYVRAGHRAALTIDGPKGPPRVAQAGVLEVARKTGAWIMPLGAARSPGTATSFQGPSRAASPFSASPSRSRLRCRTARRSQGSVKPWTPRPSRRTALWASCRPRRGPRDGPARE